MKYDNFQRDWPNVIVMDDETISRVNQRWESFRIGPFIASPSLQFKSLIINSGPFDNC
jgi:4-hydroxy-3-polyprenylbenzoate decarboxylase